VGPDHAGRFSVVALVFAILFLAATEAAAGPRVALLVERNTSLYQQAAMGFRQVFTDSQVEVIEGGGDANALNAKLDLLRKDPPQLIVAIGTRAAQAARQRLRDVPLIYCLALDPAQNQLQGTNVGGIALNVDIALQLDSMQRVLPRARRIGVIYDEVTSGKLIRQAQRHLRPGVRLVTRDVRTPREAIRAVEDLQGQVDAFWMLWDPVVANGGIFKLLVESALRNNVALIAPAVPFVEAGALMSVEADYVKVGRRAAEIAQQVLNGKPAGAFDAEPPGNPIITINGAVARRLGIPIPAGTAVLSAAGGQ
jgi:putative ABC transport system substrate-binding protein